MNEWSSHQDDERIVGMHVVGDRAAEIVQGFALAIKLGATKARAEIAPRYIAETFHRRELRGYGIMYIQISYETNS